MRTRMSGGVGGGSRKALPYPDLGGAVSELTILPSFAKLLGFPFEGVRNGSHSPRLADLRRDVLL